MCQRRRDLTAPIKRRRRRRLPPAVGTLFPTGLPHGQWICFPAESHGQPGLWRDLPHGQHRDERHAAGGYRHGLRRPRDKRYARVCDDLQYARATARSAECFRPGLSVGGKTWVLCHPQPKDGWGKSPPSLTGRPYQLWRDNKWRKATELLTPVPKACKLEGVRTVRDIHYWGHYPVADLEFETGPPGQRRPAPPGRPAPRRPAGLDAPRRPCRSAPAEDATARRSRAPSRSPSPARWQRKAARRCSLEEPSIRGRWR